MSSLVLDTLRRLSRDKPQHPVVLPDAAGRAGPLLERVEHIAADLKQRQLSLVASRLDNGLPWIALDLACIAAGVCHLPIPPFFTPAQVEHALSDSGAEVLVTLNEQASDHALYHFQSLGQHPRIPKHIAKHIAKVTYTSGSTDQPKAVLLSQQTMETVAQSLARSVGLSPADRHLILMPLAVLLENIAGVYAPLLAGAAMVAPPVAETGLLGANGVDGAAMLGAIRSAQATTAISTPHTLAALTQAVEQAPASSLRFLAVGGASVSTDALQQAEAVGLPVFQGYGLSECASVVCLNTPQHNRPGSVGRPLDHSRIKIAEDGEVMVSGPRFDGYLGSSPEEHTGPWLGTGDLGRLDPEGYLWIHGRKKNRYATAFGRNVSPEWPERELRRHPAIAQAAVYGEAQPVNVAVLSLAADADHAAVQTAVQQANTALPDYAQISAWLPAQAPFSVANGQLTGTGRPRRAAIFNAYAQDIERLFKAGMT